jgi:predicted Zn-dependent protease
LYWNQPDSAICYLEQSIKFNDSDPQVFYNLAGAYSYQKEYRKALENVAKCLAIDSQYQGAAALKKSLQSMIYE